MSIYQRRRNTLLCAGLVLVASITAVLLLTGNSRGNSRIVDNSIDCSGFVSAETKNNLDLATWAEQAYEKNWGYVYGTFGCILSEQGLSEKLSQYPVDAGENEMFIRRNWMDRRVTDCVGLIKGYGWYNADAGWFEYMSNGMPDCGTNRMFEEASVKGNIEDIPEIRGLAVWCDGHIGVYIGNGWVIEAKSTVDGVLKTRVNERNWTSWMEIPYIEYIDELPQG